MSRVTINVGPSKLQRWADSLHFIVDPITAEEVLQDGDGVADVLQQERPHMRRCVEALRITPECDVLEVGFGCGYAADRIQEANPRSHTIIECAEAVLRRLRAWAVGRPNVTVVEGTWQMCLPKLGKFDRVFFDDTGMVHPELAKAEMEFCPSLEYREEYARVLAEKHDGCNVVAFEKIVRRWHASSPNVGSASTFFASGYGTEFQQWADGLFFSLDRNGEEQLLDVDGGQVMMAWEKPYMEKCVETLEINSNSRVLEIGFGCGYSAEMIQRANPRSHTIIECADVVLQKLHKWAADKPNVNVVEGTWQARLPDLGDFDCIFFDDWGMPGLADREMTRCDAPEYRSEYDAATSAENGTHFEAFVRIALRWHSLDGTRITGFIMYPPRVEFDDALVRYQRISVAPPEHCNYFFSNQAVVPLFMKNTADKNSAEKHSADGDDSQGSTRSRSGSDDESRSCDMDSWHSRSRVNSEISACSQARSRSRSPRCRVLTE
jgi:protein-L-isoaspartate O-methyltransferase